MRHVAVDLPDPTEEPMVRSANEDELLAQLAGEEVDRLTGGEHKSEVRSQKAEVEEGAEKRAAEEAPATLEPPEWVNEPAAPRRRGRTIVLGWIAVTMMVGAIAAVAYAVWSMRQP